jgi:tetratricopeptide (TPR) repeat protein
MELPHAADDAQLLDSILQELQDIIVATEGLVAYPAEPVSRIIRELGDVLPDNERYDELFESTLRVMERRASEGEAGKALLERGYQKLERGKTYDAIRILGRAQQKLAMREYREELISALFACGSAYEAAGLLWAARANVLAAANQAFAEYWEQADLTPQALACLRKLVWLELQLGRIPSVLAWIEMASAVALQILQTEGRRKAFSNERAAWDRTLALLLLRTDFWELKWLGFLPEILDGLELDVSWLSLLYALGHEAHLRSEGAIPEAETADSARDFFWQLVNHPEGNDLPKRPELLWGRTVTFRSFVLGCEVEIETANNRDSIFLSETVLAALEALMATSLDGTMAFAHASQFKISVAPSDFVDGMPGYEVDETGLSQAMTIKHSPDISKQMTEARGEFQAWLQRLVIEVAFRFTVVDDLDSYLKQLVGNELGMGRAFTFAEMAISVSNILGENPKLQLADWEADVKGKRFPLKRNAAWDQSLEQKDKTSREELRPLQPGEGDAPDWLFEVDKLKHRDRPVLSLINIPLWDKAEWQSALYITPPGYPPYLALGFKNAEAGQSIFRGWRSKLGMIDRHEQLRVSIITGIDREHPANYRLVVGSNINSPQRDPKSNHFMMVYRLHTLEPSDTKNLDRFLKRYSRVGKYILLPAHVVDETTMPTPFWDLMIGKQELRVCPAWQLGEHDPDVCAIQEGDDPIIPEGVKDAPVLKAMNRFSKRAGRKNRRSSLKPEIDKIIKPYSEELGTSDSEVISTFLEYLSRGELKGHWPCYCGSGKRLRQCHMEQLLNARNRISAAEARNVLAQLTRQSL